MNKEISDAFNCIIEFLAVRDIAQMSKDALKQACGASVTDVIIALGSDLPVVAETACELYKAGYGEKLMFCGGIGHSTINLKKKVAKILNVDIDRLPESEAEIYACLAKLKVHPFSWIKPQPIHPKILKMPYKYLTIIQ